MFAARRRALRVRARAGSGGCVQCGMITSAEEFRDSRLSEDPEEYLRAGREEAPLQVWRDAISRFPDLKVWVVYNKTVPLEILHELSMDEDEVIRKRVADRRKLDKDLFWRLARDPGVSVRGTIAGNAKAPRLVTDASRCAGSTLSGGRWKVFEAFGTAGAIS